MSTEQDETSRQWISEAEEALNRTGDALKTAWNDTKEARMATLEAAREAASRLGKAIDEGIEAARKNWDSSQSQGPADRASASAGTAPSPPGGRGEEEGPMRQHPPTPRHELEEAAEGTEFFRTPGGELQVEDARDQAEAAGWLPPDVVYDWPSVDTFRQVVNRRQNLYNAMRGLEASAARATGHDDWADEVRDALTALESALRRHVSVIEGPNGLFEEVIDCAPHLEPDVDELRVEHGDLVTACRNAIEAASAAEVDTGEVRRRVLSILGRLAIHRQRGAELLFDTYNMDLAAAD